MPSTSESMTNNSALIVSTNWIGDAVMGMPALQLFRLENPEARITVLTKPGLKALWQMHPAVDTVQIMEKPFPTARKLRSAQHGRAYVFPNSFRSAFVPWLAGIRSGSGCAATGGTCCLPRLFPRRKGISNSNTEIFSTCRDNYPHRILMCRRKPSTQWKKNWMPCPCPEKACH